MERELFEHYLRDESRLGPVAEGAFVGSAGGAACGDLARIAFTVAVGRIGSVTFDAEGCGATRAATAAVAEMVDGSSVLEAALIDIDTADEAVGGLTPAKRHAAQLATDALHRGLQGVASSPLNLAVSLSQEEGDLPYQRSAQGTGDVPEEPPPDLRRRGISRPSRRPRLAVAMSGGVDSAVAALLAREEGAEVVGITVKLWSDPETDGAKACCSPEAVLGARALAHQLGIPHFTLDLEEDFRRRVVDRFVDGYAGGRTPNPCILCNGEVRLAAMIDLAERVGAERLLTGHYARIVDDADGPLLGTAADQAKDQSYMLAALPTELLGRLGFPLTDLTKPEVREIAARHGLPVARKAESQDLCFLAGQGKRGFLRHHGGLRERDGAIVDSAGRQLGRHRGHHDFTVGQRRGTGVSANVPLYVLATDAATNTVTVGTRAELEQRTVRVRDAVLHRDGSEVDRVKLRYRSRPLPATVSAAERGRHASMEIRLGEAFAGVAPGQTAVLMAGDRIVGHGTISA
ncbi:MAG TPA: tRNA 2-thiouridine(34) synthase MnmA [Solirubrobacterales bacterium]|nr:tRNA 2-thiouridine(34) synthase MnmA [Solirubrobacterales bacterium]